MMETNLFVIANIKRMRIGGSFRILLPFFRTSWGFGDPNTPIFNNFHSRVEFGTIWEGLRNFVGGRGVERANTPHKVRHCNTQHSQQKNIHAPVGFEPTISADERSQKYAVNGTSLVALYRYEIHRTSWKMKFRSEMHVLIIILFKVRWSLRCDGLISVG